MSEAPSKPYLSFMLRDPRYIATHSILRRLLVPVSKFIIATNNGVIIQLNDERYTAVDTTYGYDEDLLLMYGLTPDAIKIDQLNQAETRYQRQQILTTLVSADKPIAKGVETPHVISLVKYSTYATILHDDDPAYVRWQFDMRRLEIYGIRFEQIRAYVDGEYVYPSSAGTAAAAPDSPASSVTAAVGSDVASGSGVASVGAASGVAVDTIRLKKTNIMGPTERTEDVHVELILQFNTPASTMNFFIECARIINVSTLHTNIIMEMCMRHVPLYNLQMMLARQYIHTVPDFDPVTIMTFVTMQTADGIPESYANARVAVGRSIGTVSSLKAAIDMNILFTLAGSLCRYTDIYTPMVFGL